MIEPSFDAETNTIRLPNRFGIVYTVEGEKVEGSIVIEETTTVKAEAEAPVVLKDNAITTWTYAPSNIDSSDEDNDDLDSEDEESFIDE